MHFYCIVLEKNNVNNVTASIQGHSSSFTSHLVFKHSYKSLLYRFARSFDWFLFRVILTITVLIVKCFYCIVLETIGLQLGPPQLENPICDPSIYSQPTGPFKSPEWVTKAEHQNTATGLIHNQKVESTVKRNLHFDRQTFHIKFTLIQMIWFACPSRSDRLVYLSVNVSKSAFYNTLDTVDYSRSANVNVFFFCCLQ